MRYGEKGACITGIGQSDIFRRSPVLPFHLAVHACERAVADAGLTVADIDGIACFPLGDHNVGAGSAAASPGDIAATFGLKLNWYGSGENAAQFSPVLNAIAAIAAGYCNHVLVWRALGERWVPMYSRRFNDTSAPLPTTSGWKAWVEPYWATSPATWVAIHASNHMARYGVTREQLAAIPLTLRENAARNPKAVYKDPLTLDDYMNARPICTPFCLFDCDVPVDGATAMVISRADLARGMRQPPVRFEAVGGGSHDRLNTWVSRSDYPHMMMHDAARMMWARTDLKPGDVDTAHLYDGFSYLALFWLEALGFCAEGEGGAFIEGGSRISRTGELPLNSNGGQLSEGRMHGFGHLHEAVLQLRGQAGERQIKDAKVAVSAAGGGYLGGSVLLVRD